MKQRVTRLVPSMALAMAGATLVVATAGTARASDPTPEQQDHLRAVAGAIWDDSLAAGWTMNSDVADVLSQATGEILKCSQAFALVPRPAGFVPGLGYLVSYWKNLRDYYLVVAKDRTYGACVKATALNYRSAIEMASAGI